MLNLLANLDRRVKRHPEPRHLRPARFGGARATDLREPTAIKPVKPVLEHRVRSSFPVWPDCICFQF